MQLKRLVVRLTVAIVAIVGIAGTAVVIEAAPALAATCRGSTCTGRDPQAAGCGTDATTPYSYTYSTYAGPQTQTRQLRYSSTCAAWWGRSIRDDCAYPVYSYLRIERQLWTPYGYYDANNYYKQLTSTCNGGKDWTSMVPDTSDDRVRVCNYLSPGGPVNPAYISNWSCGPWYY